MRVLCICAGILITVGVIAFVSYTTMNLSKEQLAEEVTVEATMKYSGTQALEIVVQLPKVQEQIEFVKKNGFQRKDMNDPRSLPAIPARNQEGDPFIALVWQDSRQDPINKEYLYHVSVDLNGGGVDQYEVNAMTGAVKGPVLLLVD